MLTRQWTAIEVEKALPWLRRQNAAQGADIYIRPTRDRDSDLVMIDDLDRAALDQLKVDGLQPAVTVETSPDNFQAWVRLPGPAPVATRTAAARLLATRYGGDPGSADGVHFGRLAGLTNRKPSRQDSTGKAPFVRLISYAGQPAAAGGKLVEDALQVQAAEAAGEDNRSTADPGQAPQAPAELVELYRSRADTLAAKYGDQAGGPDYSRIDYMVARDLAAQRHQVSLIAAVIMAASPRLSSRKGSYAGDYAHKTAEKAVADVGDLRGETDQKRAENVRKVGGANAPGM